jgi:hypothetical protein
VKSEFVQLVLALMALVVGGAAEEILPKFAGAGFPLLMASSVFMAMRLGVPATVMFAVAAGAVEDSLCALPPATSSSFFLAVAALARWSDFPHGALVMAYPLYQWWLWAWTGGSGGVLFSRMLVALPLGIASAVMAWGALAWAERRAAVDEAR